MGADILWEMGLKKKSVPKLKNESKQEIDDKCFHENKQRTVG